MGIPLEDEWTGMLAGRLLGLVDIRHFDSCNSQKKLMGVHALQETGA